MEAASGPADGSVIRPRAVAQPPAYSLMLPRYNWRRRVLLMATEARKREQIVIDTSRLCSDPGRPDLIPLRLPSGGWPEFIGTLPKY